MNRRVLLHGLFLLIFLSAVALVNIRFEGRALTAQFAKVSAEGRDLKRENRRLQIELSTIADLRDIHAYGTANFGMTFPRIADGTMIFLPAGR